MAWAVGVGIVLWLPPVADQLTNRPGNIRQLIDHFGSPPEAAIGLGDGVRLALQHLDVWAGLGGQLVGTGRFVSPASTARGGIVLVIWLVAAVVAFRVGSRALRALHVVVAVALLLGVASMASSPIRTNAAAAPPRQLANCHTIVDDRDHDSRRGRSEPAFDDTQGPVCTDLERTDDQ